VPNGQERKSCQTGKKENRAERARKKIVPNGQERKSCQTGKKENRAKRARKKIVPNGQERKTLEVYENCGDDKKSGTTRQWAGRNCAIKNFIITYSVPIKHS
jgi:hypothetical protein